MERTGPRKNQVLPDYLQPNLRVVFTGTSVATASARDGHYYSGRGNKFYEFLWESDLTGDRQLLPSEDSLLLSFGIGLTDLVKRRASSSDANLRSGDFDVQSFLTKIERNRPFVVAFNGQKAAKRVAGRRGSSLGLADWKIAESAVYVLPSSSSADADPDHHAPKESKIAWWIEFNTWLNRACPRRQG